MGTKHGRPEKTSPVVRPPIVINQHTVQPTTMHKFLGLIVDQELRFKEHTNYALAKGVKFISQYQWLAREMKGVVARFMRNFYLTVAVSRMLYAADMFLVPESS